MIKKYNTCSYSGIFNLFILVFSITFYSCSGGNNNKTKEIKNEQNEVQVIPENEESLASIISFATNGDAANVRKLLEKGANVNELDEGGRTALMYSAFNGLNPVVEELLKHNAEVNLKDMNGRTALMFAASGNFPETVKLLLENGAEINIQDAEEHFTAFMFAAAEGQLENVKILLEHGADALLKDIDGDDALVFATNNGHQNVVEYLKSR